MVLALVTCCCNPDPFPSTNRVYPFMSINHASDLCNNFNIGSFSGLAFLYSCIDHDKIVVYILVAE